MLHLVLAETEVEMVPEMLWTHRQVTAHARQMGVKASQLVLDSSYHHAALKLVPQGDRRGRPDLLHLWLLTVLDSRAGQAGLVQPWVHTRNDEWVRIDPTTRMVRHYPRFVSLLKQLLTKGKVGPQGKPLLTLTRGVSLEEGLTKLPEPRFVLDPRGQTMPPARFAAKVGMDCTVVMGGFPHGGYNHDAVLDGYERVQFPGGEMPIWTVASELLVQVAALHVDHVA